VNEPARAFEGRRVVAASDFDNGEGRVKVGDTEWKAKAESGDPVSGDKLVVISVAGATLIVEPALDA
jgi:membrane protein implicated in regulation of membrane protease activity